MPVYAVGKVGSDYIGLLLLGFINVSIAVGDVSKRFYPHPTVRAAAAWLAARLKCGHIHVLGHFLLLGGAALADSPIAA